MTDNTPMVPTDAEIIALMGDPRYSTIGAVREAISRWGQPAHSGEPVAWMTQEGDRVVTEKTMNAARRDGGAMLTSLRSYSVALVRAAAPQPVEREPLTADEIMRIILEVERQHNVLRGTTNWAAAVGRAIEAAHGIGIKGGQHGADT